MKTPVRSIVAVSLLSSLSLTAQVNQSQIIPFQAGTPARAADMNQNIQELITAIDNNTATLKVLQAQMTIIAGLTPPPKPSLEQNIGGSVYCIGIIEAGLGTATNRTGLSEMGNMRHSVFSETATLTLNTNGTFTLATNAKHRESNLSINSGFDASDPNNPFPLIMDVDVSNTLSPADITTIDGTWSISGNTLDLKSVEEEVVEGDTSIIRVHDFYSVSVDGNTLFNNGADTDNDDPNITMHSVSMDVGTRISKEQPLVPNMEATTNGAALANDGTAIHFFDSQSIGTTGRTITIKNTGGSDLLITGGVIQTQGSGISIASPTGITTIAPGAQIDFLLKDVDVPLVDKANSGEPTNPSQLDVAGIQFISNDQNSTVFTVNITSWR